MYKTLDSFQNDYILQNADLTRTDDSINISTQLGNVISIQSPEIVHVTIEDLISVEDTTLRFIVNINNEYYTSKSLVDDLKEAEENNNPFFTIDFITIINVDMEELRKSIEVRKLEERSLEIRGVKLTYVENLNLDVPEDIVKQINWALSPSTGKKSKSLVTDFAEWDIEVDGLTMTYNFSDKPSGEFVNNKGRRGSRSGRRGSRNTKQYTGTDINPAPGEIYPPADQPFTFPNGSTQVSVVFLSKNFELGTPVDIFLNNQRYKFFNEPINWDVFVTDRGKQQPARGKLITLDKKLVSVHFDLDQVRKSNLNKSGFGNFTYKILKRNRDTDLNKLNTDSNSINYWAGTTDQTGILQAYANTYPKNVFGQTSFTFPYYEFGKTNMDIGVNTTVESWNSTGKFVIVVGAVGKQTLQENE